MLKRRQQEEFVFEENLRLQWRIAMNHYWMGQYVHVYVYILSVSPSH